GAHRRRGDLDARGRRRQAMGPRGGRGAGRRPVEPHGSGGCLNEMSDLVVFMQNVDAVAFLALGVATAVIWLRSRDRSTGAVALIVAWAGTVIEPIVRFWLVARGLPKVQAWRLRSLSLGFAGLVGILLFALILAGARVTTTNAPTQLALQAVGLAIVPLLYVSFAP